MPGVRTRTAAMILAVVPDIGRFGSAAALASYFPARLKRGHPLPGWPLSPAAPEPAFGLTLTPVRGHRALKRSLYQSAFASLSDPVSRAYYDRKRSQGKSHQAALVCLARRRTNVIYALMRDQTP